MRSPRRPQPTAGTSPPANIPDMTFGLSDHYDWDGASVVVDDAAKRRVSVQSAYNDTATDFHSMVRFARHSLDWLSHSWPGVPYPYEKSTVFQGGAGMEYPMMVNDESYPDTNFSSFVALHEIAHTYFPFYMGIRRDAVRFHGRRLGDDVRVLVRASESGEGGRGSPSTRSFASSPGSTTHPSSRTFRSSRRRTCSRAPPTATIPMESHRWATSAIKDLLGDEAFRKCLDAISSTAGTASTRSPGISSRRSTMCPGAISTGSGTTGSSVTTTSTSECAV